MNKKAFSLIEVLGAIVIISIALVPVIGLIQSTLILSQRQEWETKALNYAQQKMEEEVELLRYNFSQPVSKTGTIEGNYIFNVQHTQDGSIPLSDLRILTVTTWYDEDASGGTPDSGEIIVTLNSKVAQR